MLPDCAYSCFEADGLNDPSSRMVQSAPGQFSGNPGEPAGYFVRQFHPDHHETETDQGASPGGDPNPGTEQLRPSPHLRPIHCARKYGSIPRVRHTGKISSVSNGILRGTGKNCIKNIYGRYFLACFLLFPVYINSMKLSHSGVFGKPDQLAGFIGIPAGGLKLRRQRRRKQVQRKGKS